jgi:4-hydroxy-3-methylbut-2-enyl diphosphate reductase
VSPAGKKAAVRSGRGLPAADKAGHKGGKASVEVMTAKRAGFCFGVKRAMDIAFGIAAGEVRGACTLGPIIHNPQVIQRLRDEGVKAIDASDIEREDVRTLIIRTHGIPRQLYDKISARGCRIIDATCPFVKKAQQYAGLLRDEGYQVVILGDLHHPEVQGIMSYAGDDVVVVDENGTPDKLKPKVGVIVQTTQPVEALKKLLSDIVGRVKEVKVFNTICNSTALRLKETERMAVMMDAMIVVGGKNSANTTQLANLCRSLSVPTYHIETASELRDEWFAGARKIGITAGASTPGWIISEVEKRMRNRGGRSRNGN